MRRQRSAKTLNQAYVLLPSHVRAAVREKNVITARADVGGKNRDLFTRELFFTVERRFSQKRPAPHGARTAVDGKVY